MALSWVVLAIVDTSVVEGLKSCLAPKFTLTRLPLTSHLPMPVELPVAPIPAEDPEQKKKKPEGDVPKAGEGKSNLDEELVSRVVQPQFLFLILRLQSEEDQQLKVELEMLVERLQVRYTGVL